jgi:5'-nucleotidase
MTAPSKFLSRWAGAWLTHICLIATLLAAGCTPAPPETAVDAGDITISVIGTSDVHGQLLPVNGNRGLSLFGGYVNNLRAVRSEDGGAVLLIDAGDMWQGTLESNLTEGEFMVEAYNALGYTAAAIGNHEFDFGPAGDKAIPENDSDDGQGALKLRAAEADFPILAANLIDIASAAPVDWPNVSPSVLVEVNGVNIGIIGVMTGPALRMTMSANVTNLRVAPLVESISEEAERLRGEGANLIVVSAHAGGRCKSFDDPFDLASCSPEQEIMRVAAELPAGLVDLIVAGHTHQGMAHDVNGIAISSSFSSARAFGRVDFVLDPTTHGITARTIHAPQGICAYVNSGNGRCMQEGEEGAAPATYAGGPVLPDPAIAAIADKAAAYAEEVKLQELGVFLETPITVAGGTSSALGHLFMDAVLALTDGDIVIHNVMGGLRASLPQGELVYGSAYQVYPFDNRVVTLDVSGADLRRVISSQALKSGRRAGFSGMRVMATCEDGQVSIEMRRMDGTEILDGDPIAVITTDFLALGGDDIFTPIIPSDGFSFPAGSQFARDLFVTWMRNKGGNLNAADFLDQENPRWAFSASWPDNCQLRPAR